MPYPTLHVDSGNSALHLHILDDHRARTSQGLEWCNAYCPHSPTYFVLPASIRLFLASEQIRSLVESDTIRVAPASRLTVGELHQFVPWSQGTTQAILVIHAWNHMIGSIIAERAFPSAVKSTPYTYFRHQSLKDPDVGYGSPPPIHRMGYISRRGDLRHCRT